MCCSVGEPAKVRVAGLKLSQAGSGEPSARVAAKVRLESMSTKTPEPTVKLKGSVALAVASGIEPAKWARRSPD
jgi:hypothetical protein